MADPNPVPASVGKSTVSTLAIPAAEVVVGVTERGRALTVAEVRTELDQGSVQLAPTKGLVSVDPKGSVFARFERVTPGTYTARAERVDGSGVMQATADPKTFLVTAPHTEVDLYLFVPQLEVKVTDTSSPAAPIEGADLRLTGASTLTGTTDAGGTKTFQPLPLGDYAIKATHPRYEDGAGTATVTTTPSHVTVALKGRLDVHVVEKPAAASGQPPTSITAATVALSGAEATSGSSDASGIAHFKGINTGAYTIKATHPGYEDGTTTVVVPAANDLATVELARISLEITMMVEGQTTVISEGEEKTRIVGQLIKLTVRSKPPNHALSDIQWSIPGERVQGYTATASAGVRTELADAALKKKDVSFFWITSGAKAVQVTATVAGEAMKATATVNVLAPTGLVMNSTTGAFTVGPRVAKADDSSGDPAPADTGTWLNFGALVPGKAGIHWDFRAVQPVGGQGSFAGFQLITANSTAKFTGGSALRQSTEGQMVADKEIPYAAASSTSSMAVETGHWESEDSPGIKLAGEVPPTEMQQLDMNYAFQVYFMYRPRGKDKDKENKDDKDDKDSIWVTLGLLEWHCRATLTRIGPGDTPGAWSAVTNPDVSKNPSGKPESKLPIWTGNMGDFHWEKA